MSAFVVALLASSSALAQGSDGRTESFDIASPSRPKPKIAKASYRQIPKPTHVPPKPGTLILSVNETASEVSLIRTDDFSIPPRSITANAPIVKNLDPGSYQLRIKKTGYFDETRNLEISPGEQKRMNVTMRPKMALLTVKTNLSDAEIDVENTGTFNKPLKRYLVMPATYRITLRRRGYMSQTITADLSLAGKEQNIYVVLEPLRIDSVLWTANKAIERGELDTAENLVNDVLVLNSSHAKANLVRGMVELHRGSETASTYLLKAIDGGETVSIPMRVLHSNQLVDIDFTVDRAAVSFANEKYLDLNFRVLRNDIDEFSLANDQEPFLTMRGKSSFYGKLIHPELRLRSIPLDCSPRKNCVNELNVLYRFISDWRAEKLVNHSVRIREC